jgi:hypothetical protein
MTRTLGLSDNQRTWIGIAVTGVIAINVYVGTLSGADVPPRWVIALLGGIAILANVFKDQLGIRDATTARVAKEYVPQFDQGRLYSPPTQAGPTQAGPT